MTQYQPPYYPPQYSQPGHDPSAGLLAPGRRAGLLMIILGALVLVYALCNGGGALLLPADDLAANNPLMRGQEQVLSPEAMRTATIVFSAVMGIVAVAMIVLGILVRQNRPAAIITSLIISIILLAGVGLLFLLSLIAGLAAPLAFIFACVLAIPLALFGLCVYWLAQATRNAPQLRAIQSQYQAQYWQYQQNQQSYHQPWQGMPPPPPPPSHE